MHVSRDDVNTDACTVPWTHGTRHTQQMVMKCSSFLPLWHVAAVGSGAADDGHANDRDAVVAVLPCHVLGLHACRAARCGPDSACIATDAGRQHGLGCVDVV